MMTLTIFSNEKESSVVAEFKTLSARERGMQARLCILDVLKVNRKVELDFHGAAMSPSFADECVGMLARELGGVSQFKQRIILKNVAEIDKVIVKHVLARRSSQAIEASAFTHGSLMAC